MSLGSNAQLVQASLPLSMLRKAKNHYMTCLIGRRWLRRCLHLLLFAGGGAAATLLLAMFVWWLGPYLLADPMLTLAQQTPVRQYFDRQGELLFLQRTFAYQWRLPLPLSQISKPVIQATLAAEDADFYSHHGVDYPAVLRAFKQNLRHRRIVSGASTITMQLAGLAEPGRRRSWWRKLRQAFQARSLEKKYSKERILTEYLNRVPFGGKLYGIEAAAWYYFGKTASQLNTGEAALLCGLPQKPNGFRPDRHLKRARQRQKLVLQMMERRNMLAPGEAEKIFQSSPLPLRNFRFPSRLQQLATCRDGMYFAAANKESGGAFKVVCHLDREIDALLFRTMQEQARQLPGVQDGAAIVMDSSSGKVLAMIGTLDFSSAQAGQVNAALAVRSAGSTLKPFLYAEAIDGGILVEDSMLLDAPVRYGEYAPGNYDGRFHGRISAGEALSLSLNTPAVRLLAALKPKRLAERFTSLHLWTSTAAAADSSKHQLAMTLGTAGHSLLGLTTAYATLARGGDFVPAQFSDGGQAARKPIFTPGCCAMLSQMLRRRPLPSSSLAVSWKTGTSNGNRDAWCFAYTPEFTVGIWFGNKDGAPAAVLTGAGAATPAAAAMMSALYRNHPPPAWPPTDELFQAEMLCADSGLSASASCLDRCSGSVLRDIPLRQCQRCRENKRGSTLMILSPTPGQYIADATTQTAMLALRAQPTNVLWYVNNRYIGPLTNATRMPFTVGRHVLHAIDDKNKEQSASVKFSVSLP